MIVETEIEGGVGRVTLNRPEVRNALSGELMDELDSSLAALARDPAVRVVVLAGAGKAFCAGADLRSMQGAREMTEETNRADALRMGGLFHRVAASPKPVVARVHGPAIGGGVGLMAACDVVVAAEETRFQFSEVRLGIVPAVISPFCIRRLGPSRAKRLFLTGEAIDARRACDFGLVDVVAAAADLDAAVGAVCADLVKAGPNALAAAKRLVDDVCATGEGEVLALTSALIARLRVSDEAAEGMAAFLEKRAPSWVPGGKAR